MIVEIDPASGRALEVSRFRERVVPGEEPEGPPPPAAETVTEA